jgi:type IV secretion system protein VirD4
VSRSPLRVDPGKFTSAPARNAARPVDFSGSGFCARLPDQPAWAYRDAEYRPRVDGHIITIAPTGTGKAAGPVICNALTLSGELIVLDVKGEMHRVTA